MERLRRRDSGIQANQNLCCYNREQDRPQKSLGDRTPSDFEPHSGRKFRLTTAGSDLELNFVEVKCLGESFAKAAVSPLFVSPLGAVSTAAIYTLTHAELGTLELFLVPVRTGARRQLRRGGVYLNAGWFPDFAQSDAHDLRFAQSGALASKESDEFTVPFCRDAIASFIEVATNRVMDEFRYRLSRAT